jgi:glycosyltransferase involved in cell wall biosynthesis
MSPIPPRVSVVLAVYNGERYLAESVESILQQSWKDFEFLVINDGSTDQSEAILQEFVARDPRIRLMTHENHGLTRSLSEGLLAARGELIARIDADDVSLPDRLRTQVAALDGDRELILCGAGHQSIDARGRACAEYENPVDDAILRFELLWHCPFVHSAVMFRRAAAVAAGGYDVSLRVGQDHDLWQKLARVGRVCNHPDVLVKQRFHSRQITLNHREEQLATYLITATREMLRQGYATSEAEAQAFFEFVHRKPAAVTKVHRAAYRTVAGKFLATIERTHPRAEVALLRQRLRWDCLAAARQFGWFSEAGGDMLGTARRLDPLGMSLASVMRRAVRRAWHGVAPAENGLRPMHSEP